MKKIFMVLGFFMVSLFAQTGLEIYEAKCVSCHVKSMTNMEDKSMKAPAMNMVSMRVKHMTVSKDEFVSFVKDYILQPSKDKGYCMPMAYRRFGTMPAIGKQMTKEERDIVAHWLYDDFKGSWGNSMGGKTCNSKNSKMNSKRSKCGSGKCGSK